VKWENEKKGVIERLDEGSKKAQEVAQETMKHVREAVFHWKDKRREMGVDQEMPQPAEYLLNTRRKISPED